jgi:ABC-type antimicrobial peptide transport system permease subunit
VSDELSIDKFHTNGKQLVQVMENNHESNGIVTAPYTPDLLSEYMKNELPEIKYAASVTSDMGIEEFNLSRRGKNYKARGLFAGTDFFNMFSFDLIAGNKSTVLNDKASIVISESLAKKMFGSVNAAMGKQFKWQIAFFYNEVIVNGIFKDVPGNSSLQFDFLLSYESWKDPVLFNRQMNWGNHGPSTFLVLRKGTDINKFSEKIKNYIKEKDKNSSITLFVRPFSDAYLYGSYENGQQAGGRIEYVRLFSIIAVFLLFIACINFMNLSTAKASTRLKEVGIKKAVGAGRRSLIFQYMSESMFLSFLSLAVALILVELLLPQFNIITGKELSLFGGTGFIIPAFVIAFLTGLISGSYPALYLSRFNPVTVLKGKINTSVGELWARKGLVVLQFTLSVILIVSVLVVYKQIEFIQNKNLGYDKDNVLYFPAEGNIQGKPDVFISELKKIPGVVNASGQRESLIGAGNFTVGVSWQGKNPDDVVRFGFSAVGYNFFETHGITMKEGRSFNRNYSADSLGIILNEEAARIIGYRNPVGKSINMWGTDRQIIGVVKNYYSRSMHELIQPSLFILSPNEIVTVAVKIKPGSQAATIEAIKNLYSSFNLGYDFYFKFLDEDYQELYTAEMRVSVLSKYFALIAIIISCLGLFGLTAFTAERKTKEIGIRKILGAGEFGILYMLSAGFTKMVIVSITIAIPLSYMLVKNWLDSFAYKIDLNAWYFVSAGVVTLFIAWFTVGIQAIKAARINPIVCLRNE